MADFAVAMLYRHSKADSPRHMLVITEASNKDAALYFWESLALSKGYHIISTLVEKVSNA